MAVTNFVPAVWSKEILFGLRRNTVWTQAGVANRRYEGEISGAGDRVYINGVGAVTIGTYTPGTDIADPEALTSTRKTLTIDQMKYFNFEVDDVDRRQANADLLSAGVQEAVYGLRKVSETYVASVAVAGASSTNALGSTGTPIDVGDAGKAFEALVDLGTKLDEADVPAEGRWVIAGPSLANLLTKDQRYADAGARDVLNNGFAGEVAGFTVLKSNYAPTGKAVAGFGEALAFAEQIPAETVELYRPEKAFSSAIKGLHLYGATVVRPEGLAVLTYTI